MNNATRLPHMLVSPLLKDLPETFCRRFVDEAQVKTFAQKEVILAQGEPVDGMHVVAHGSVEITSINPEGQSVLIHLSRQCEVFGEVETLADRPAAANCIAASRVTLLFWPKRAVLAAIANPTFLRNVMRVNHDRLLRDNALKFVDQFYPVEQRLCDYLYRLSADRPEISKTQTDLAGLLGCARQTLNRELGRLRDRLIISMKKGKVRVLDRHALLVRATTPHDRGD